LCHGAIEEHPPSSKETINENISRTAETVKATVNKSTGAVKETVNRTTNVAQAQAQRAREGFNTLLEEQPLVLGAFGVALGAIIGAALPSTEQEDRLVGDTR
jgi:beta-lactamase regulating signal transducer with metallopeptidase domain